MLPPETMATIGPRPALPDDAAATPAERNADARSEEVDAHTKAAPDSVAGLRGFELADFILATD